MNNFKFLLIGTSLSFIPLTVNAQCVETTNCETLGYTETSCNGGKGVKCPFGNKWACLPTEAEICRKNGFTESCTGTGQSGSGKSCGGLYAECSCALTYQYICTGTGYAGGAGSACGGKYTQCTCSSGYEWKDGVCQQQVLNGAVGDLYYCNGTVVGVKTSGMDFYVAMSDFGKMYWSDANKACQNYSFCGRNTGSLPTLDQLKIIYNNKYSLNSLFLRYGGVELTDGYYWSSLRADGSFGGYFALNMSSGYNDWLSGSAPGSRPVLVSY